MRLLVVLPLLGACGRLDFTATGLAVPDASSDVAPTSYTARVLADQPRFYFRLGEPAGLPAHDATGNGNDTAYELSGGAIAHGQPGAIANDPNTAVEFDGDGNAGPNTGAAIEFTMVDPMWAGDFSIELFIKAVAPPPLGWGNALFICEDYQTNGFRTGWRPEGTLELWTTEAGATSKIIGTTSIADQTWHHVVFIRHGAAVDLYVDGNLEISSPVDYLPPDPQADCGFGAFHGMPTHGVFDEVAGYDRALTPTQIATHLAAAR